MIFSISDIIGIAQACILALGLSAIYFEYRNEKRSRGYATYVQTGLAHIELQKWAVDHPEAYDVFAYDKKISSLTKAEKIRYEFCSMLLVNFEIIYGAWKNKWMKTEEWQGWEALIRELMQNSPDILQMWKNEGNLYSKKFREFINGLVPKPENHALSEPKKESNNIRIE